MLTTGSATKTFFGRDNFAALPKQASRGLFRSSLGTFSATKPGSICVTVKDVALQQPAAVLPKHKVTEQTICDLKTMFSSLLSEFAYWVEDAWVEGHIPAELEGTYFRNGPGLQVINDKYVRHTFDGDGMVLSLSFKDGKAFFRNKFVRTSGFIEEQAAGKPLYRSPFCKGAVDGSRFFNPFDLSFKNVANTGVLHWAGKLMALWEVGRPHLLDPHTLETLGESDLDGQIGDRLAGHYRITTEADGSKHWVTFSATIGFGSISARFYEFDEQGRKVADTSHQLKGIDITFIHDMAVTENYYVLVIGPIKFNLVRFATEYLWGTCSIAQCLTYTEDKKTKIMLFPRPGRPGYEKRVPRVLEAVPCFPFHHVNAYEVPAQSASLGSPADLPTGAAGPVEPAGPGPKLVIDTIAWDEVDFDVNQYSVTEEYYQGGQRPEYYRLVLDLDTNQVQHSRMLKRTVEFPAINEANTGKPHTHSYFMSDTLGESVQWAPAQALLKVSIPQPLDGEGSSLASTSVQEAMWRYGPRDFPGEPMFIPRPGSKAEDDGWVLQAVHNAGTMKADVYIFDAQRISDGPVATIHLPHHLPASLHGSFTPQYFGPDLGDESVPCWQEVNTVRQL